MGSRQCHRSTEGPAAIVPTTPRPSSVHPLIPVDSRVWALPGMSCCPPASTCTRAENIWLVDFYGGAADVTPAEYYAVSPPAQLRKSPKSAY